VLVSPLLFLIGFNIWKVVFDIMHCLDLGLLQPAVASSMWELVEDDSVFRAFGQDCVFPKLGKHKTN
jgi:hypothetical protein